jgi:hypothetical protein
VPQADPCICSKQVVDFAKQRTPLSRGQRAMSTMARCYGVQREKQKVAPLQGAKRIAIVHFASLSHVAEMRRVKVLTHSDNL